MSNIIDHIKSLAYLSVMTVVLVVVTPAAKADDEDAHGHWYVGGSTGYLKPDTNRESGNTRSIGVQAGYQFSDRWSLETGYQVDALSPGKDDLKMLDIEFVRHWGNDYRFLMEYGYTHISLDARVPGVDGTTAGFHIGAGISAFLTRNLELRGDAKLVHSQNEKNLDGVGTLSLNWHFVEPVAFVEREEEVLGESSAPQSLPETTYREPVEAEEPAPAPVVVPPPAAEPVPRTTFTLINFGFNSVDIDTQYGAQLDAISTDIKSNNSTAVIEGHTDDVGSASSNKILSMDRAIVVKRELKERGVSGDDLSVVGYGEERPVAPNDTDDNRAKNRRVEVKVYDKQ